jgi:hypothetical protein
MNEPLFEPQVAETLFELNDNAGGWDIWAEPELVHPFASVINMG